MRLSIIVPVLNSHEIVRRQLLHFKRVGVPDGVEIIYMDDGSDPPLATSDKDLSTFRAVPTNDTRPWTWAVARNSGAKIANGNYLLMTDLDYIITRQAMEKALAFDRDYLGFRREFGVLDENGVFTQDLDVLQSWGLLPERARSRGVNLPPHPNNFTIRKDLFFQMGGYREDLIGKPYPAGEDNLFKKTRKQWVATGKMTENTGPDERPTIYMFPNGQYCGDVDADPKGMFHTLTRKTDKNWAYTHPRPGVRGAA